MCQTLIDANGNVIADNIEALRKAVYPVTVPIAAGYSTGDGTSCLCPVDMTALAAQMGWTFADDLTDYVLEASDA